MGRVQAMALQAKRAHVGEIAFSATLDDRHDMIGIPQRFSISQSPFRRGSGARRSALPPNVIVLSQAIHSAYGANAPVALQHALAQMPGVTAQPPFFHAKGGTECDSAGGYF